MTQIEKNLDKIKGEISNLVKEKSITRKIRLVAVSKTKPISDIKTAFDYGHFYFGENYIQELLEKSEKITSKIKWHFIGNIQSNKIKLLAKVQNLVCVETIHKEKVAKKLNSELQKYNKNVNVMVQVNTSGEDTKGGVNPSKCGELVKFVIDKCPNLNFIGLMTIGDLTYSLSEDDEQPDFDCLVDCRKKIAKELNIDIGKIELSMGMSNDFLTAIKYGSTSVRVGSKIFGHRNYNK